MTTGHFPPAKNYRHFRNKYKQKSQKLPRHLKVDLKKTKTSKPSKSTLILRHLALKALKETHFKLTPHSIIQHSTPQNISINRNNDSCITVDTTKKIRCVFNSGPLSTLKSDTWEKTQSTNIYRPQYHVNRFDPKRDSHEFTRNILPFIQLHAAQSSWNSQAKTVSTFTNINTLTFLTSHTTEYSYF